MDETGMVNYAITIGILGALVWAGTAALGASLKKIVIRWENSKRVKPTIAIIAGPLIGVVAHEAGHLQSPNEGVWAILFAALMGLLGTGLAMAGVSVKDVIAGMVKK